MNSKIQLVGKELCTACGACKCVCPTQSIDMHADNCGCDYPRINSDTCIECGLCTKVCPADKNLTFEARPNLVYASWSKDQEERDTSASGGIASAIYRYALQNGIKTFGVVYTPHEEAIYKEIKTQDDIWECKNSKYVFSDVTPILPTIKQYIKNGDMVIAIALPCQAAAIINYIGGRVPNLLIIDIICHGVCPVTYLNQHISNIDNKKKTKTNKVFFRDPSFYTGKFVFSTYDEHGKLTYKKRVQEDDVYQIGYHSALTYRENCYSCKYAQPNRMGDLTIADFSGLGSVEPISYERKSISCVMVSSQKGSELIDKMVGEGYISVDKRPEKEAFGYEKMLTRPSIPHKSIEVFKNEYIKTQDFDKSAKVALKKDIRKNKIRKALHVDAMKKVIAKCSPKWIKRFIKGLVKRG